MSSNQTQKWSSPVSFTRLFSRLTRTLSFSSKKNKKMVQQTQPVLKNPLSAPKSVPVIRRYPPQPIPNIVYDDDDILQRNFYRQGVHVNMYEESDNDDDEDYSRYSLQPNLSLFNISMDNIHNQSQEYYQQMNWINDVFHSTKIGHD